MAPELRLRDAVVPLRHYRLDHVKRDVAHEIPVDFYSDEVLTELPFWTSIVTRMRVKIGAGAYSAVGATRATAVDMGAFTAGETKQCTLEIKVPAAFDTRHEELALNLGYGV